MADQQNPSPSISNPPPGEAVPLQPLADQDHPTSTSDGSTILPAAGLPCEWEVAPRTHIVSVLQTAQGRSVKNE